MKWIIGILSTFILGVVLVIWYNIADFTPKDDSLLLNKISELELKVDSLNYTKDSIRTIIDSTHVKIITNEKHYQERINTIMLQPISTDSCYISDYIRFHRSKRDSTNI